FRAQLAGQLAPGLAGVLLHVGAKEAWVGPAAFVDAELTGPSHLRRRLALLPRHLLRRLLQRLGGLLHRRLSPLRRALVGLGRRLVHLFLCRLPRLSRRLSAGLRRARRRVGLLTAGRLLLRRLHRLLASAVQRLRRLLLRLPCGTLVALVLL